jgi:hypothetical protein
MTDLMLVQRTEVSTGRAWVQRRAIESVAHEVFPASVHVGVDQQRKSALRIGKDADDGLVVYLREMGCIPMLDAEQELVN